MKTPRKITEFRPISLCNVIYKIATKAIANRLKGVLRDIIGESQSAFVPGRLILDNVIAAFELMHSLNRRNIGKIGWLALKLDMSKACDRVEWYFLTVVMKKMGLGDRLISLVVDAITTSRFAFIVNRIPQGEVVPSRGIHQGCPLSPYLFLLCAEGLSARIKMEEFEGRLMGYSCSRGGPRISHLFFVDDSLMICRANVEDVSVLRKVLWDYEFVSSQAINMDKSSISYSPNTSKPDRLAIKSLLGLATMQTHERYLGLPTLLGRNKWATFNSIKERVWRKLRGWKSNFFSSGG